MQLVDRIGRTLDSLSSALDLIASGTATREAILDLRARLLEAKEDALAAKEQAFLLQQENLELRQQLQEMEDWERERIRYELRQIGPDAVAYVVKEPRNRTEEILRLCPNCFDNRKRSFLQLQKRELYRDTLACHRCGGIVRVPNDLRPPRPKKRGANPFESDGFP